MADKRVRVAVIGTGGTAGKSAGAFAAETDVELAAIADPVSVRRARALEGVARRETVREFEDYRKMLDECPLDAVCLGLPTWMHATVTEEMLNRGLHVLCEKPPTDNAAEMARVADLAASKRLTYMFVRQERFSPVLQEGRRLVQAGELGEIYYAETAWIRCRWSSPKGWRHDKERGGGVLLDLGIHAIDSAWFVMGCPRPVEVSAGLYCAFANHAKPGVTYTADDAAVGVIRFENRALLHFAVAFSLNMGHPPAPGAAPGDLAHPNRRHLHVYGTRAGIENGSLVVGEAEGVRVKPFPAAEGKPDSVALQAREFVRAIRAGDEPLCSASQALMLMQMLDAARESADKGLAVRIPAAV